MTTKYTLKGNTNTYLMMKSTSLLAIVTVTGGNFSDDRFWCASAVAL